MLPSHLSFLGEDLPMVTGTTDNGSCDSELAAAQILGAKYRQPSGAIRPLGQKACKLAIGAKVGYSRKTARGASSPAKPALHIPELQRWSVSEKELRTLHLQAEPEFLPFLRRPDKNCAGCSAGGHRMPLSTWQIGPGGVRGLRLANMSVRRWGFKLTHCQ